MSRPRSNQNEMNEYFASIGSNLAEGIPEGVDGI